MSKPDDHCPFCGAGVPYPIFGEGKVFFMKMSIEGMGRSLDNPDDCYIDVRVTDENGMAQDEALILVRGINISRQDFDRLGMAREAIAAARHTLRGGIRSGAPCTCDRCLGIVDEDHE